MKPHSPRPHVLISAAVSLDGYLDDDSTERLLLSNQADFDRVDHLRSTVDAILVGAGTIRADNPTLEVRSQERRRDRKSAGKGPTPTKVTITSTGNLDPQAKFFTGRAEKLVYTTDSALASTRDRLAEVATVVPTGPSIDLGYILADMRSRNYEQLMVEGGATVLSQFMSQGLVDQLHLAIAPFILGGPERTRFIQPGTYPFGPRNPLRLRNVEQLGEMAVLHYQH
ncbi:RibD family protein [Natronoglycomyces albus]|uniref:Dihydrofolate reductase family protein n=1 Tax=Natronoglycomyces albus TaxID=2811108 RepID=A0A895XL90_9ACTN|nr:dihydrofolate reductase family protein [Natronoglycomyces albus]QSB05837.1 dihydrofolate reductase family protein [Natronoglycomyces albus]